MALEFMRNKGEDIVDYMIRLYDNRAKYELSNQEVADLLNREDETEYDESRWRKLYQGYKNFFEPWVMKHGGGDKVVNQAILDRYELERIEAKKADIRYKDMKREYNKLITNSARFDNLRDTLREEIKALPPKYDLVTPIQSEDNNEIIIMLSDWHVGETYNGTFNQYNIDIFHERIETLLKKIHKYLDKNPVKRVHVASLGDQISGQLRVSSRVSNEVDAIKQIKIASEALAYITSSIADKVEQVEFYSIIGNHSRIVASKEDLADVDESFERIIAWYLEERLKEYDNINIHEDRDGFIHTQICGQEVVMAHGDFDKKNSATKIGRMLKTHLDYILIGHTHSHYTTDDYGTKVIVNPSLMGENSYASQGRFGNSTAQTIVNIHVTPEGLDEEVKILTV